MSIEAGVALGLWLEQQQLSTTENADGSSQATEIDLSERVPFSVSSSSALFTVERFHASSVGFRHLLYRLLQSHALVQPIRLCSLLFSSSQSGPCFSKACCKFKRC